MKKSLVLVLLQLFLVGLFCSPLWAQEHTTQPSPPTTGQEPWVKAILGLSAALAVGASAIASAWAQSKIGSAAAGAIAEKPEVGGLMIVLEAIPETMIILGFVIAIMIVGKI